MRACGSACMGTDASASAGYVSSTSLALAVKALNKTSTFEQACLTIRRAVSRKVSSPETETHATPEPECSGEALFEAVLRAGMVLRTRHHARSAAWVHGDELFAEALRCEERFAGLDLGKVRDLKHRSEEARRGADAEDPERDAVARQKQPTAAFEGQLSGELEREFDRASSQPAADAMQAIRALAERAAAGDVDPATLVASAQPHARFLAEHGIDIRVRPRNETEAVSDAAARAISDGDVFFDEHVVPAEGRRASAAASDAISALRARTSALDEAAAAALSDAECAVCRDAFEVGHRATRMPCSARHVFHAACVAEWLERNDSCPMCRAALPVWLGRETQYA